MERATLVRLHRPRPLAAKRAFVRYPVRRVKMSAGGPDRRSLRSRAVVDVPRGNGVALKPAEKFVAPTDPETLANDVVEKLEYFCGGHRDNLTRKAAYNGASWSVREFLFDRLRRTMDAWRCRRDFLGVIIF